jgi:Zn-dependent peptidase ImmA (M78 family)
MLSLDLVTLTSMPDAHINPAMLRWASERTGLDAHDLATSVKKPVEVVLGWFDGTATPTFKQAQELARRLRVPFGYLFLAEPPDDRLPLADFRRHPGQQRATASVDLRDVISDALLKQDWYRDFRLESEAGPVPVVGRFEPGAAVPVVVSDISKSLSFEVAVRPQSQADQFLRAFVKQVEELGILVMRNGIVRQATNRALDVDEFRGFSLADPMAPAIFINNVDSNAAQIFTLAHELAHIWTGQGGISDADITVAGPATDIEVYCNAVAGELLLPWSRIAERWVSHTGSFDQWATVVAQEFHVSTVMVARQLWQHQAIAAQDFFNYYESQRANWRRKPRTSQGGDYYLSVPIRSSRLLTQAILDSVRASETSIRDASRLLGVKPANLSKLRKSLGIGA